MKRKAAMAAVVLGVLLLAALAAPPVREAQAGAAPIGAAAGTVSGETIAQKGVGSVPACVSCHGSAAQGDASLGTPRLAGLPSAYIVHELKAFAAGTRRNALMATNARGLSPEEMQAVATYLAGMKLPPPATGPAADAAMLALGKRIAERGNWPAGVPACWRCHGPGGVGVAPTFPPLSGQSAAYLASQLEAWRNGSRRDDPQGLMRAIAHRLSPKEITAVTTWLATLPAARSRKSPL